MKVFLGMFLICFLVLMLSLGILINNVWALTATIAAMIAVFSTALYFQQEKIATLEKRLEQLEIKE